MNVLFSIVAFIAVYALISLWVWRKDIFKKKEK